MGTVTTTKSEIESWLKEILKKEDIADLTVEIEGNTEVGSGYVGDIFFLKVETTTKSKTKKDLNLVLKVGKRNKAFRSKFPVICAFLNEIYFYEKIYPKFQMFQQEKNIEEPFNKVPKYYGTLTTDNLEVIALENLRVKGYCLWDKKKPLTRKQIEAMIKEYAKFHAVSIALQDQKPEEFEELANGCDDFYGKLCEYTGQITIQEELIDEIYELLQGELEDEILEKWKNFKAEVRPFLTKFKSRLEGLNVIIHGDCWSNNFMHQIIDNDPVSFAILDWQMAKPSSPAIDVGYFLFACLSEEDMKDADEILKLYHDTLCDYVGKMGSNPELYPFGDFLQQWRKHSRFGIIFTSLIHKFSLTDGAEVPDFVKAAEEGHDIAKSMAVKVKDAAGFRKRMKYLVKFAVENELV